MNVAGVAIFTSNGPSRDYMPLAERNRFGFSYWLDLVVCILLGLSSFTVFLAAIAKTIHFQGPRDVRYSEDMMLGRIWFSCRQWCDVFDCSKFLTSYNYCMHSLPLVLWHCWLGIRKSIRPVKFEWWSVGMVICLELHPFCLHMVQVMPLPSQNPITSCFI